MTSWNGKHNYCEACWVRRESVWTEDPETRAMVRVAIIAPTLEPIEVPPDSDSIPAADVPECCSCTKPTVVGIHVDHDPDGVYFCDHGKET